MLRRYKGKSYRATVEIVRTADQVADFCRKTCIKLECCPNLFGPRMVLERCSENCSVLTKTKYSEHHFSYFLCLYQYFIMVWACWMDGTVHLLLQIKLLQIFEWQILWNHSQVTFQPTRTKKKKKERNDI